jgi:hypothetical protein
LNKQFDALLDETGAVKVESRTARLELLLIAIAQVAEKVRLPTAIRKEHRVHFRIIEAQERSKARAAIIK